MNYFRRFLPWQRGDGVDAEQGDAPPFPPTMQESYGAARPSIVPESDQLGLFRHLVGISTSTSLEGRSVWRAARPAPNLGIYRRVVDNEARSKKSYSRFSFTINGCLGLQLVVAAALTAMGAAGSAHSAITAFGAINTVIAGFLTFLKGSGLPNRLKYYETEWRKVREFIEQRERDFSHLGCPLNVYDVVRTIEIMYQATKADIEANTPEVYSNPRSRHHDSQLTVDPPKGASSAESDQAGRPRSPIPIRARIDEVSQDWKSRESGYAAKAQHGLSAKANDVETSVREFEKELAVTGESFNDHARDITSRAHDFALTAATATAPTTAHVSSPAPK